MPADRGANRHVCHYSLKFGEFYYCYAGVSSRDEDHPMETSVNSIKTKDGVEIFYKDWGKGQPIVFSHGWPLSSDDWDAQMLFFSITATA
jgi:hypothetical protein